MNKMKRNPGIEKREGGHWAREERGGNYYEKITNGHPKR